jgi:ribose 5-phosphate isomerase A
MGIEIAKQVAGEKAATLIRNGMVVGLGTGSTAAYFIAALVSKVRQGLQIRTVASSSRSAETAKQGGLIVCDINDVSKIDLTVDGADEIDPTKNMIKGGGGAHFREKILASASHKMIVIVDETKCVSKLGKAKLPVEVFPYGAPFTEKKIKELGFHGSWRKQNAGKYTTENGNFLFDIAFPSPVDHPEKIHAELIQIPGVIETGFFFNLASEVIVGKFDGTVEVL